MLITNQKIPAVVIVKQVCFNTKSQDTKLILALTL